MKLSDKSFITTESWDESSLRGIIELASRMKYDPHGEKWNSVLKHKKFLMMFHNPSLRTHLSFEAAVTDLGGSAIYYGPGMGWSKTENGVASSESLKDIAKVVSRYVDGVGIRISMDAVPQYGDGYRYLTDFAHYADVPVVSMAGDRFHPCQAMADLMGWAERFTPKNIVTDVNRLRGKTLLLTWGGSGFARPWASVQSHLLLAARFGMNIKLAYPEGYALDPEITDKAKVYCDQNKKSFQLLHDTNDGYENTDVVYVRNWISNDAYKDRTFQYRSEIEKASVLKDWIVTTQKMERTNKAIFANPMPVDRGKEAEDSVVDSDYSVIYDVAENRLYIQKALLSTLIGG